MLIQHKQKENQGLFFLEDDGEIVAEMSYSQATAGTMIIEHTEVEKDLRGNKVGFELVRTAVEFARQHNYKISPVCTFARSVFDDRPDFHDVLI